MRGKSRTTRKPSEPCFALHLDGGPFALPSWGRMLDNLTVLDP